MPRKTLWYKEEAQAWVEALPLGNGRLGAMMFSGAAEELISLNEDSFWAGFPQDKNAQGAAQALPAVQALIHKGRFKQAQDLAEDGLEGQYTESFLPLCDLRLSHRLPEADIRDYRRELKLANGLSRCAFTSGGVAFTRESFITQPGQAFVLRLTADRPGQISFTLRMDVQVRHTTSIQDNRVISDLRAPGGLLPSYLRSDNPIAYHENEELMGMRARCAAELRVEGGRHTRNGDALTVENADAVTLIFCARTSFNGSFKQPQTQGKDEKALVESDLDKLKHQPYETLKETHIQDFTALMNRVDFRLDLPADPGLSTGERLERFVNDPNDPLLFEQIFHYGRYLLIAASREGSQPANLQGIWNRELRPPWSSNYTVNINTQMNYWPAEPCNLSELHSPLFDLIDRLRVTGAVTARTHYGARGAVCHHNTDLWGLSNPVGNKARGTALYALWPLGYAWLCRHLMEHYDYTLDTEFLKDRALPAITDAALFLADSLKENGQGGLSLFPATSPENTFHYDGEVLSVSRAATMNTAIAREVFANLLRCGDILGLSTSLMAECEQLLPQLPPYRVGSQGQLLEWEEEFEEAEVHHRHISHLYPLHPGREFSVRNTPELAKAVRRSLDIRGDEGTGWSLGWKISQWARLKDGDRALKLLQRQLQPVDAQGHSTLGGGGTYRNLFGAHPPFQIDGNFAASAGIAEMLLQNEDGCLDLLPALPALWANGAVRGLRGFGAAEVDLTFESGRLKTATITSHAKAPQEVRVRCQGKVVTRAINPLETITLTEADFV